ncbi:FAD dependent oxidoreductase superfamily [Grosmannia clavigera kw1407]|uniref:FAD dependent oxidoreductase superfamily n=1 Tax=Grosmannia clavigera (strain kw1407 / UAMH 11150) TaxID=655863 RepID=F0X8T5_GROCL|nr:FAD dependent oxidoreductase superfamily [Grosmannia clavigera kw1407]EFX05502.1 FAD dependent oxidoreductase superfamily [Grosmannia clavigera kw1407]
MVLPIDNPTKSYWIEAAASPLRSFQSAATLPATTDLVIVGSGYTGASAAYWVHKHTAALGTTPQMVMLEARDVCGGATGRNGGQLRPHAYSRYPAWSARFGAAGALALIQHEMAHLAAFRALLDAEGIADETCLRLGETFDAAMTVEAWTRLRGAFDAFVRDHGRDGDIIRECRLIDDPTEAEAFTQMKGCLGAIVHPAGQIWPYKLVHALLRIVLATGRLQLHANTPVASVSAQRDSDGFLTVTTPRGSIRARAVLHATNRWASHLLPEFDRLVFPCLCTVAAVQAPAGFIRNTGAQHWDGEVNNYHNQLPPPYNVIVVGGAKAVCAHYPHAWLRSDDESRQLPGVPSFYKTWPKNDLVDWPALSEETPLGLPDDQGGVWTGVESASIDSFPFVGPLPQKPGHFVAAGFAGHGMPRILLSTAHITPLILADLGIDNCPPDLVAPYPPLPPPFVISDDRLSRLQSADAQAQYDASVRAHEESAKKPFCNEPRCLAWQKVETEQN